MLFVVQKSLRWHESSTTILYLQVASRLKPQVGRKTVLSMLNVPHIQVYIQRKPFPREKCLFEREIMLKQT